MQWNIGFAKGDIHEIIRNKKNELCFKWLPAKGNSDSIADPFILKTPDGKLNVLYEDFSMIDAERYGKIFLSTLDADFNPVFDKEILDTLTHTSYPFLFEEGGKTYIIPETRQKSKVSCYEYDFENNNLINEQVIINNLPLLDSTIFKKDGKYWLFATLGDYKFDHSKLYIYFSDSLFGPYKPHKNNPVKYDIDGTRPAGNFIVVDGEIYRPAQNCGKYYGKSLAINKVTELDEYSFKEEFYFEMTAHKNSEFNAGLHTLNVIGDVIAVDGIKMVFSPIKKLILFYKKLNWNKKSEYLYFKS